MAARANRENKTHATPAGADFPLDRRLLMELSQQYRRRWGVGLHATDSEGRPLLEKLSGGAGRRERWRRVCVLALGEALRWGEPAVQSGEGGLLLWAVPVMRNSQMLGGLVAATNEKWMFPDSDSASPRIDTRQACAALRELAEQHNLTNAALLEMRRIATQRERERAEAIHAFKGVAVNDLRAVYLLDEPMLLSAIRKGDRGAAREILNRLLVGMIHRAGDRLDLVKSFFMELVVSLCRTAVEAGGAPEELLGANFVGISELSRLNSDEQLAPWLHEMLERILDAIGRHRKQTHPALLSSTLRFMAENCCRDLSRNQAAEAAYLSPSHFSRYFKKHLGQSFTAVLNRMRIDKASELLIDPEQDIKMIALKTGFTDQSYFTKVFRRLRGVTPAEYRKKRLVVSGG